MALVIDRFDLRLDGTYRGFEDFCALNARRTDEKYRRSYETSVMKRFGQFANSTHVNEDTERLFTLIALNCALRNGDAHLKNFGIVYDEVQGEARLAPAYDLVTTSVYLTKDSLALTLNGSTKWPTAKELRRLGETRAGGTPAKIRRMLERIDEAIQETAKEVRSYTREHSEFTETGQRMLREWESGSTVSVARMKPAPLIHDPLSSSQVGPAGPILSIWREKFLALLAGGQRARFHAMEDNTYAYRHAL
jgi:serine/threonine-protein kinase HipA